MTNKCILFSILIPAYKSLYLAECIESIINQTYKNFELIIVDDNSPEDLNSIVNHYDDERIRYYKNDVNFGALNVVDNWNKCLSFAVGDYVICMGDDDRLLPNCLSEYLRLIDKYAGLNVYHALTQLIDEDGSVFGIQEPRPEYEDVFSLMYCRWNGRKQYIGDFLFERKELVRKGGFYKLPLACGSDDVTVYMAAKDTGIANSQIPLFQYRENKNTISRTGNRRQTIKALFLMQKWCERFLMDNDCNNIIASLYRKNCIRDIIPFFTNRIDNCLKESLSNDKFTELFYWFRNKKRYQISNKRLVKAFLRSL